jgi:O-antigen ligase
VAHLFTGLLTLAAAGAILAVFVFLMLRGSLTVAAVILVVFIVTQGIRDSYQFPLVFRGTSIYLLDLLSLALVSVGVYRALSSKVVNTPLILVFSLLLLVGVHFLWGAADYGIHDAFNKSRGALWFIAPIVYAATVRRDWDARLWRLFPVTGLALLGIACFYYFKDGFHAAGDYTSLNGELVNRRPVTSSGALLVLDAIVLMSVIRWPSRRVVLSAALISAVGLIALQERTAWMVALVVGVISLGTWAAGRSWNPKQLAISAGVALGTVLLVVFAFLQSHALSSSVHEMTKPNSTIRWRITVWRELIAKYHSLSDGIFGLPAGPNFWPHSLYVGYYLRFGIPGVLLILGLGFVLWKRRREIAPRVGLTPACVGLLLLVQFLHGLVWDPDLNLLQGFILGVFVAALSAREPVVTIEPENASPSGLEAAGVEAS